jgi:hypothetical protein
VADDLRRCDLRDCGQVLERNHRACIRAHIVLLQIFGLRTKLLVGLDVDAVRTIVEIEIVNLRRTHVYAESVRDLLQRYVQALGLLAIDGDQELRIACRVTAEQARQIFARVALANHLLRDIGQFFQAVRTLILHFKLEASNSRCKRSRAQQGTKPREVR